MKRPFLFFAALCAAVLFFSSPLQAQPSGDMKNQDYVRAWAEIDSLEGEGLYRSALEKTLALSNLARREGKPAQVIKTIMYRGKYMKELEEDGYEAAIAMVRGELETAPFPQQAILQSMLAQLLQEYLESYSWEIGERTNLAIASGDDIKTWTPARFQAESARLYLASLEDSRLKTAALGDYGAVLMPAKNTEGLWSSLYDLLTHRALEHFSNSRSFISMPAYQFYLDRPEAFADAADFAAFSFSTRDSSSYEYQALRLFQQWLQRKIQEGQAPALIDADMMRLIFVHEHSVHADKDSLFRAALTRLEARHPKQPGIAEAMYHRARLFAASAEQYDPDKGDAFRLDKKQAKAIAEEAIRRFPGSYGASQCARLIAEITHPNLRVEMEQVLLPGQPALAQVYFRNTPKAYFKLVPLTEERMLELRDLPQQDALTYLSRLPALKSWNVALPDDGDLQFHRTEIRLDPMPRGHYALLFTDTTVFEAREDSRTSWLWFAASELAYFSNQKGGDLEFIVVHRDKGIPLEGVSVKLFEESYDYRERKTLRKEAESARTDANGIVRFSGNRKSYSARFEHNGDLLFFGERFYLSRSEREEAEQVHTHFFLDRAIYRPGQTIYFKGILTVSSSLQQTPQILPNRRVKVTFRDVNYQEVATRDLVTNAYGSFHGSFTAPKGSLLGVMSIESDQDGPSRKTFRVEEYKRPRFEVTIKPLEGQPALGDEVEVQGEAKMYAGSSVDGGTVRYRVVRSARFPWWPWWRGSFPFSPEAEIASGEVQTDASGVFKIAFKALPDPKIDPESLPEFSFHVQADVIDITGETHAAERWVNLGYVNIRANLDIPEWIDAAQPGQVGIHIENLDGQPAQAKGKLSLYSLDAPGKFFINRFWSRPDRPSIPEAAFRRDFPLYAFGKEDDPNSWKPKNLEWESAFDTESADKPGLPPQKLAPGYYHLVLETTDAKGKTLEIRKLVKVFDSQSRKIPQGELLWLGLTQEKAEPGDPAELRMASGYGPVSIFLERGSYEKTQAARWVQIANWESELYRVREEDRGNLFYNAYLVRHNRAYAFSKVLQVPWSNKELQVEYQTFRDKLLPGQNEEWRLRITGPKGERVAAELLAAMYDASLDQFAVNAWSMDLFPTYNYTPRVRNAGHFNAVGGEIYHRWGWPETMEKTYPALNWFGFDQGRWGIEAYSAKSRTMAMAMDAPLEKGVEMRMAPPPPPPPPAPEAAYELPIDEISKPSGANVPPVPQVRANLRETVFFFPQLSTDAEGAVILKFTMNEALTRWKFMTLAHTKELQTAIGVKEIVTQKELMVLPNLPRFVREGDAIELSAKVSNLSGRDLEGQARLELFDALTMQPVHGDYGLAPEQIPFRAEAGQSAPLLWKIVVPKGASGALTVRVSAVSGNFTDAEENTLPVLTNRMLVTESLPLYVRGGKQRTYTLESMKAAGESQTLSPVRVTLEMTSNPAWLAVKALPYLMEYPYECAEQIFSRYYANALAASVAGSNPRIKAMYEQWKNTGGLESPLSKNQELKALLLQETPWVLDAQREEDQQRNIGLLFDLNNLGQEQTGALAKLEEMQLGNGGFPWFAGGPDNWYITQHIIAGLGKMQALGIAGDQSAAIVEAGLQYLDGKMQESYEALMHIVRAGTAKAEDNHLSPLIAHYLYTRSFFEREQLSEEHTEAFEYYLSQAKTHWTQQAVMEQGLLALALNRYADKDTAQRILASLRERALRSDELGMYWKTQRGYSWNQLPVETQSLLIEAFDEAGGQAEEVEEMKIWLLRHKQTNSWPTTKATSDAVYSLLKTGARDRWMSNDKQVEVSFPGIRRKKAVRAQLAAAQQSAEPGTGYYKLRWEGSDIQPSMATVELENPNKGIAWGGLYWQYFEDLDKIRSFEETPLTLRKTYYREVITDRGPVLEELTGNAPLQPGDKLVARLELRVDREMEYVHMKDMRGSGLEPVNPLSAYKWQGGLGYYESPGDAATNFFFDYLPRGTYVFEYALRVVHRGDFSNGTTSIQCMYAPEFSSHTAGGRVLVGGGQ